MQKHLIIFIKNPLLGTVKTRLAKDLGDEAALQIYLDLMQKCRDESLAVNAKRHLFYSKQLVTDDNWNSNDFVKDLQAEGNLGNRIKTAFEKVFQEGGPTIIIGSDCYDLTSEVIEEAFEKLKEVDVVIGPANDGGYYLLGTNKYHPSLFDSINWSTSTVLEETSEQANKAGLTVALLRELVDLDTIDDIEKSTYHYKK